MFFPDRIISIQPGDRVLEIGPGATPHPRSDVFLERKFESEDEFIAQSGHVGLLSTSKELIYYSGDRFPFNDKEFDYVICSHVLEHVDNIPQFLDEIMRVGKKGYLEFPTFYYEYLYNIEEHLNVIVIRNGVIKWLKKSETPMPGLEPLTDFFRISQFKGYRFQPEMNQAWHQGFEWSGKIREEQVERWQDLCLTRKEIEEVMLLPKVAKREQEGVLYSCRLLLRSVAKKLGIKR